MIKTTAIALGTVMTIVGTAANAQRAARWEYQGVASTGERVYVNLDSIRAAPGGGYYFVYQMGRYRPQAYTLCDGSYAVAAGPFSDTFEPMQPESEATQQMLRRVCDNGRSQ